MWQPELSSEHRWTFLKDNMLTWTEHEFGVRRHRFNSWLSHLLPLTLANNFSKSQFLAFKMGRITSSSKNCRKGEVTYPCYLGRDRTILLRQTFPRSSCLVFWQLFESRFPTFHQGSCLWLPTLYATEQPNISVSWDTILTFTSWLNLPWPWLKGIWALLRLTL